MKYSTSAPNDLRARYTTAVAVIPSIGADLMGRTWISDIRTWSAPDLADDGVSLLSDTLADLAVGEIRMKSFGPYLFPGEGMFEYCVYADAVVGTMSDSLKTEEKTVTAGVRGVERDRIPAIDDRCDDSPPVHQLGVSRLHRTNVDVQPRKHSLERR